MHIDRIEAKSILDTRGRPTVETTLSIQQGSTLNPNSQGRTLLQSTASIPSGKSTGKHEAVELRDEDDSVTNAIANVNGEIATAIIGCDFNSLDELDTALIELDGTPNKSRLGANAILSVSIAAMRLSALQENIPLWKAIAKRAETTPSAPRLFVNVMNGGAHADFKLPFQEYLLVIEGKTSEALPLAQEMFAKLGERLGTGVPMGDEGGYAPTFDTLEKPFEILTELVSPLACGYSNTSIAIDAAASELFHDGTYRLLDKTYTPEEFLHLYEHLVAQFPIHSIEDPFAENAPDDFARLTASMGEKILIIGDDLTVTNPARVIEAAKNKEINAVLIKPNQIGTVKEAFEAVKETYSAGFRVVASHRSGETSDTFIADFAYGIGAHGLKAGGLGQQERLAKYERLLTIEHEAETR
ncbi:MAG: phosphopyruvate hydratase [Candidatus Paceibacterota bacterium]|jgi:enolase